MSALQDDLQTNEAPDARVMGVSPLVEQAGKYPYRTSLLLALPVFVEQALIFGVDMTDTYLSGRIGEAATEAMCVAGYVGWMASMIGVPNSRNGFITFSPSARSPQ